MDRIRLFLTSLRADWGGGGWFWGGFGWKRGPGTPPAARRAPTAATSKTAGIRPKIHAPPSSAAPPPFPLPKRGDFSEFGDSGPRPGLLATAAAVFGGFLFFFASFYPVSHSYFYNSRFGGKSLNLSILLPFTEKNLEIQNITPPLPPPTPPPPAFLGPFWSFFTLAPSGG